MRLNKTREGREKKEGRRETLREADRQAFRVSKQ